MTDPCPCCATVPRNQLGPSNSILENGDVLGLIREFRAHPENLRKPLKDILCGAEAVSVGGNRCRREGGCESRENQCLIYRITAPFYQVNLPFLVSDKEIKKSIENVVNKDRAIKKLDGKNSAAANQKKAEFNQYLAKIFPVLSNNIEVQLRACPARYFMINVTLQCILL